MARPKKDIIGPTITDVQPIMNQVDNAQTSSDQATDQPEKKQKLKNFVCTYAGCNKAFQRKEHLNRHTLNRKLKS
jgi:hypothetical protein